MKKTVILSLFTMLFMMIPCYAFAAECTLDDSWMTAESEWTSWGYLKMTGEIADYSGDYLEALSTNGKITLTDSTTVFTEGTFMNYDDAIILVNASDYKYINVDQVAGTATIDYWDAMYQFSQGLIPAMKEQAATEAGFGATVFFRHAFIDVKFDSVSGSVTEQHTRKNCFIGTGKMEEVIDGGDTYSVPIGDMYGCFDANVDGSVGEELNMMFKNEFTEDEAVMLEFFNTRSDGTVAVYGEEDYVHLCTCYEANGETEVNCWNEYDGPGGKEDCPAVVEAADDCGEAVNPDDDIIGEDSDLTMPDEDSNEKVDDIENLTDNDETVNDAENEDTELSDDVVIPDEEKSEKSKKGCSVILVG